MKTITHDVQEMKLVESDKGFRLVVCVTDGKNSREFILPSATELAEIGGEAKERHTPGEPWANPLGWRPSGFGGY